MGVGVLYFFMIDLSREGSRPEAGEGEESEADRR